VSAGIIRQPKYRKASDRVAAVVRAAGRQRAWGLVVPLDIWAGTSGVNLECIMSRKDRPQCITLAVRKGSTPPKRCRALELPLLGSSRRRPVGPTRTLLIQRGHRKAPELQQLASVYASSCHPMLAFDGFHAGLCWTLLAQMSEFVTPLNPGRPEVKSISGGSRLA
jgi:hypothetical protein